MSQTYGEIYSSSSHNIAYHGSAGVVSNLPKILSNRESYSPQLRNSSLKRPNARPGTVGPDQYRVSPNSPRSPYSSSNSSNFAQSGDAYTSFAPSPKNDKEISKFQGMVTEQLSSMTNSINKLTELMASNGIAMKKTLEELHSNIKAITDSTRNISLQLNENTRLLGEILKFQQRLEVAMFSSEENKTFQTSSSKGSANTKNSFVEPKDTAVIRRKKSIVLDDLSEASKYPFVDNVHEPQPIIKHKEYQPSNNNQIAPSPVRSTDPTAQKSSAGGQKMYDILKTRENVNVARTQSADINALQDKITSYCSSPSSPNKSPISSFSDIHSPSSGQMDGTSIDLLKFVTMLIRGSLDKRSGGINIRGYDLKGDDKYVEFRVNNRNVRIELSYGEQVVIDSPQKKTREFSNCKELIGIFKEEDLPLKFDPNNYDSLNKLDLDLKVSIENKMLECFRSKPECVENVLFYHLRHEFKNSSRDHIDAYFKLGLLELDFNKVLIFKEGDVSPDEILNVLNDVRKIISEREHYSSQTKIVYDVLQEQVKYYGLLESSYIPGSSDVIIRIKPCNNPFGRDIYVKVNGRDVQIMMDGNIVSYISGDRSKLRAELVAGLSNYVLAKLRRAVSTNKRDLQKFYLDAYKRGYDETNYTFPQREVIMRHIKDASSTIPAIKEHFEKKYKGLSFDNIFSQVFEEIYNETRKYVTNNIIVTDKTNTRQIIRYEEIRANWRQNSSMYCAEIIGKIKSNQNFKKLEDRYSEFEWEVFEKHYLASFVTPILEALSEREQSPYSLQRDSKRLYYELRRIV